MRATKIVRHMLDVYDRIDKNNDDLSDYRSGYLAAIDELNEYLESEVK